MPRMVTQTSKAKHVVYFLLITALFAYFSYHLIQGDRGVISWYKMRDNVTELQIELNDLNVDRTHLAHRVKLLSPNSIDTDLLEEQARKLLNYSYENDIIVMQ